MYNITLLKEKLGDDICNHFLFVYACTGCDSTSRTFGIGKKLAFRKLMKLDPVLTSCANAFTVQERSQEHISNLGKHLIVNLFGGKPNDTLSSLCHFIFTKKWQLLNHSSPLTCFPQLLLLQNSTFYMYTIK